MKLLILDKDGTLTTPKSGEKFVQHPEDQMLLPGVAERIAAMADDGWTIAIASNQGGVAAGHKSPSDEQAEMLYLKSLLPQISLILSCPDFKGELLNELRFFSTSIEAPPESLNNGCHIERFEHWNIDGIDTFRKPSGGMLEWAIRRWYPERPKEVIFVGDRTEDQQAAAAARVRFQWADAWRAQWQH